MSLRSFLDDLAPTFEKGGRLEALYPAYEAIDTALYTPGKITAGASHIRDSLDLKRIMITVWLCAFIPVFVGSYFVGLNANEAMQALGQSEVANWRGILLNGLVGFDPNSVFDCLVHGLAYFIPLYITVFVAGIIFEIWFASKRGHEVNEGYFVTSILFTLTLPPSIPLWMAAIGVIFGVVIGKEVFGGTGKNFLNPALTGRAFLYFAYPAQMSGDAVWVAVDGWTQATPLGSWVLDGEAGVGVEWWNAFIGYMPGSMGETSTLAILIAGVLLLAVQEMTEPGSIKDLALRWAEDDSWKDGVMRPKTPGNSDSGDDRLGREPTPQYQYPEDADVADPNCSSCVFLNPGS
ncbi:RnfABCDGE type electron transport complex subunit D [bacterium]|nr:RnfABCDGE type electron transport complex subunit D [bacterium]